MTKDCDQREESPSREEDERQWAAFVIDYARKLTADTCWHGGTFAMRDYRQRILEGIAKWDESRANVPRTEPDPRTVIGPAGSQCGPLPTIDVLATVPNSSAAREALGLDQKTMDEAWASACRQIRSAGEDVATLIRRAAQNIEAATPDGSAERVRNQRHEIARLSRDLEKCRKRWVELMEEKRQVRAETIENIVVRLREACSTNGNTHPFWDAADLIERVFASARKEG